MNISQCVTKAKAVISTWPLWKQKAYGCSAVQMKRPLNVDIKCDLRVMGWSKSSFSITSDEGDGYGVYPGYMNNEGPELKPHHFEEWAEQLTYAAQWCREKAKKEKRKPKSTLI